jgi:hypothetical protein
MQDVIVTNFKIIALILFILLNKLSYLLNDNKP